jgi:hypothetical protein
MVNTSSGIERVLLIISKSGHLLKEDSSRRKGECRQDNLDVRSKGVLVRVP